VKTVQTTEFTPSQRVRLWELNDNEAVYISVDSGIKVVLPRDMWENDMDAPVILEVREVVSVVLLEDGDSEADL
jgi:hypothetical protein